MGMTNRITKASAAIANQGSANEVELEGGCHRVLCFGVGDMSYPWQLERIEILFSSNQEYVIAAIDDAIEARECLLVLDIALIDEAKNEDHFMELRHRVCLAVQGAYRYLKSCLSKKSIFALYEEVCTWYKGAFLRFLVSSGLENEINDEDFTQFLHIYPFALRDVLTQKKMVQKFDYVLREAMIANPKISAESIISFLARPYGASGESLHFPQSITTDDINLIFCAYAECDYANSNYLKAIVQWRNDWGFAVSPETKTAAFERYQNSNKEAMESDISHRFSYGVVIGFSGTQMECIRIGVKGDDPSFLFSVCWIDEYLDFPTLLNNFIFVFGFIALNGLLEAGKPDRARSVFLDLVGLKTKNEYREGIGQTLNRMKEAGIIHGYREILGERDIELESLIEWYFNSYIAAEYSIDGFHIEIERGGSFLSRCRSIGPEIEKVLKMYQLHSKGRQITKDALRFEQFSSFQGLLSRVKNKYVYGAGEEYETACSLLLSNQCMLSYSSAESKSYKHFLDRLRNEDVNRAAVESYCSNELEWLIEKDFVTEDSSTGSILPTNKTLVTYRIWRDGCIVYAKEREGLITVVNELLDEGYLKTESTLLTRGEASYFSYVFHNRDYVNALALRNKYLHGECFDENANSETHRTNYELLLRLLIQLILKLDDEFSQTNPPVCKIELVDWPLYEIEDDFQRTFDEWAAKTNSLE